MVLTGETLHVGGQWLGKQPFFHRQIVTHVHFYPLGTALTWKGTTTLRRRRMVTQSGVNCSVTVLLLPKVYRPNQPHWHSLTRPLLPQALESGMAQ